jgi:bla regulator protein blaR1
MLLQCKSRFWRSPLLLAGPAALVFMVAHHATAQPPPPPPGLAQMPTKADPTLVIPQFDVISVKPAKDTMTRVQFTPDGLRGMSVTVRFLLYEGYGGINHQQVIGEPEWSSTEGFDIEAKVAPADLPTLGKMTFEQRRTMFQSILADRFKLVIHHETRELPVYVLSVAKGGTKLKPSAPDDPAAQIPRRIGMMINNGKVTANDAHLSTLVSVLSRTLGRTIIDKTGLTGNYDFTLEYAPEEGAPQPGAAAGGAPPASPSDSAPSIFTALQEQLGLKLESTKGPVDVIVIDHIEKAAEN